MFHLSEALTFPRFQGIRVDGTELSNLEWSILTSRSKSVMENQITGHPMIAVSSNLIAHAGSTINLHV